MRLRRSDCSVWGIGRRRCVQGFSYYRQHDGAAIDDPEVLARVRELVNPPAWREVWICPHPSGHIQAVGRDEAGRRQYIYPQQWRSRREAEKHDHVLRLARASGRARGRWHRSGRAGAEPATSAGRGDPVARLREHVSFDDGPQPCPDVGFVPQTDNGAWDIETLGISCAEVESLLRESWDRRLFAEQFEVGGFACQQTGFNNTAMVQVLYRCTRGARSFTFTR